VGRVRGAQCIVGLEFKISCRETIEDQCTEA